MEKVHGSWSQVGCSNAKCSCSLLPEFSFARFHCQSELPISDWQSYACNTELTLYWQKPFFQADSYSNDAGLLSLPLSPHAQVQYGCTKTDSLSEAGYASDIKLKGYHLHTGLRLTTSFLILCTKINAETQCHT
jgi:hypothetical protein